MRRVLGEAARKLQHGQLRRAASITIMQDVRQKFLGVMYTSADIEMVPSEGERYG